MAGKSPTLYSPTDEGLREKIAGIIRYADTSENPVLIPESLRKDYLKAADSILSLIDIDQMARERGYVKLDENQKLPPHPYKGNPEEISNSQSKIMCACANAYELAQTVMRNDKFRRVA